MTAQEARKQAKDVNINENDSRYSFIQSAIKRTVAVGKYEVWIEGIINSDVVKKLREDGFTVGNPVNDRNETITQISWNE